MHMHAHEITDQASSHVEQVAQLSQRDRATLCVVEYFAKSLNIIQDRSK